jgi:pimeloyl-ACP methyl ester carboxylesterase
MLVSIVVLGLMVPQAVAAADAAKPATGRYASIHGLKMYYEVHGQGPPLLLLHGGLNCIEVWPQALEYFSRGHQVIAPEQMGHGHTADDPSRPMDYHAMAEDTAELLRQLGIERLDVLGWSDGGVLGLDLAIHHPTLVRRLAAGGANYAPVGVASGPESAERTRAATPDKLPAFMRPCLQLSPDGPTHLPALFERVKRMWLTQPNFSLAQLGSITAPTLIMSADHDFARAEHTVEMWRAIPGAALWIAPNSDHGLPKKRALLFNQTVDEFFAGNPPKVPSSGASQRSVSY